MGAQFQILFTSGFILIVGGVVILGFNVFYH